MAKKKDNDLVETAAPAINGEIPAAEQQQAQGQQKAEGHYERQARLAKELADKEAANVDSGGDQSETA